MKIKMLKDYKTKYKEGKAGTVADFPIHVANALIRTGVAEIATEKKKED